MIVHCVALLWCFLAILISTSILTFIIFFFSINSLFYIFHDQVLKETWLAKGVGVRKQIIVLGVLIHYLLNAIWKFPLLLWRKIRLNLYIIRSEWLTLDDWSLNYLWILFKISIGTILSLLTCTLLSSIFLKNFICLMIVHDYVFIGCDNYTILHCLKNSIKYF